MKLTDFTLYVIIALAFVPAFAYTMALTALIVVPHWPFLVVMAVLIAILVGLYKTQSKESTHSRRHGDRP